MGYLIITRAFSYKFDNQCMFLNEQITKYSYIKLYCHILRILSIAGIIFSLRLAK